MKRIKAACITQTLLFQIMMEKRQSMQKKAIVQECEKYKAQLEKSGTKYKILSENMILLEKGSKKIRRIYFSEDLS